LIGSWEKGLRLLEVRASTGSPRLSPRPLAGRTGQKGGSERLRLEQPFGQGFADSAEAGALVCFDLLPSGYGILLSYYPKGLVSG